MDYRIRMLMKGKVVPALLSIALGVVIIIARRAALDLLVKIIGGLVITGGFALIAVYLTRPDPAQGNLKMVLIMAAVTVLAGILLITFAPAVVDFFPTLMGVILILNGLSHLTGAGASGENRVLVGLMGILVILAGIAIILRPGIVADMIMTFIGASFIVNGLFDLLAVKMVNRIR